jgi:prepilin-type N-terminal cleavage/methylation domain-containing protein
MQMNKQHTDQKGFTIVELMLSTVIFSIVMLMVIFAMMHIGRTYTRSLVSARMQQQVDEMIYEISQDVKFEGGTLVHYKPIGDGSVGVLCVGLKRYTYLLNEQRNDLQPHVMLYDQNDDCGLIAPAGANLSTLNQSAKDLVQSRTRLYKFEVSKLPSIADDSWRIDVGLAYGDDDQFNYDGSGRPICKSEVGSQNCKTAESTLLVTRRVD